MELFILSMMTAVALTPVTALCPEVCECPAEPPPCPPGVSAVPDRCACCKVCAAQLNQDCSPTKPCDHHKGLECNYGNDVTFASGICRAKSEGRSCEYNGRIYQNGESFHAGCKHQCTCVDGAVGCTPVCSNKLPPASPSCPHPRLVRLPGQCCFSVDCHKNTWALPPKHEVFSPRHDISQLLPRPAPSHVDRHKSSTNELTDTNPTILDNKLSYKHPYERTSQMKNACLFQTTDWSQCSRSCGAGVSSRVTNMNPLCKMEKETRLCTVRPCHSLAVPAKEGKNCSPTQRAPHPVYLSYGECVSDRPYQPNYCGVCSNGRCCSPRRTRTVPVTFVCPDGGRFHKSTMFILSCKCSRDCGHLNQVALPPQLWMYGDTHKAIN